MIKKYSWISGVSIGLPILLLLLLFMVSHIESFGLVRIIMSAQFIGAPLSIVLSIIALFKKHEKKMVPVFVLIVSIALTGLLAYFLLLGFGIGEA